MWKPLSNGLGTFGLKWLFCIVTICGVAVFAFVSCVGRLRAEAEAMESLTSNASIKIYRTQPPEQIETLFKTWCRSALGFDSMANSLTAEIHSELDLRYLIDIQRVPAIRRVMIRECRLGDLKWFRNNPYLQVIQTSMCEFENLEGLTLLPRLEHLELDRCYPLTSLKGLSAAPQGLKTLKISVDSKERPIIDRDAFAGLRELEELELGNIEINDLTWLADCRKLRHLSIQNGAFLLSLKGIEQLQHLQTLEILYAQQLDAIQSLASLAELRSVHLPLAKERNLAAFQHLHKLERLYCIAEELESLDGLEALTCLEELTLAGISQLKDLKELSSLSGLKKLTLADGSQDLKLDSITSLKKLNTLHLQSCNSLRSIAFLSDCSSLETLKLHNCKELCDIEPLSQILSLKRVEIRKCAKISQTALEALQLQCPGIEFKIKSGAQ